MNTKQGKTKADKSGSKIKGWLKRHLVPRKKEPNFVLSVIVTTARLFIIFLIVAGFAGFGTLLGVAKAYVDGTPTLDVRRIEDQNLTSFIYDMNGNLITEYKGLEHRIWASLDEIPQDLIDAFIATEDVRFMAHNGLDYKRLVGAFINNLLSETVQGGSTITQQLIKNTLLSPEQTYKRKIQEAYLALQLEQEYTKQEILEAYLNTIYLGSGNYGVKAAAMNYFGKELKDLTLRECAVIAGITKNPYYYDPRLNFYTRNRPEVTYKRANLVLTLMYENGFINRSEYEQALFDTEGDETRNAGFTVIEESSHQKLYDMPYFIEYVVEDVIDALMKQNGWTGSDGKRKAENLLLTGGLHIYTTVDPEIQKIVEDTLYNWDDYPSTANPKDSVLRVVMGDMVIDVPQPQAAAVVLDHHTGELRAIVGGRVEPQGRRWLNRAGSSGGFPIGSAVKPISVYASFIEAGYPGGIIIEDVPVPIKGWDDGGVKGYPNNYYAGTFYGPTPYREAVIESLNVSSARTLLERLGVDYVANKLRELGITSKNYVDTPLPNNLALGTDIVNMIEVVGAYGALANKGEYRQPISFTKVLDKDGNIILSNNTQRKLTVFKESTAFIITNVLEDVMARGTGKRAKFPNMSIAGKSGTNTNNMGVFFAGYTPYYTAVVGIAEDNYKKLSTNATGGRQGASLWRAFMERVHKEKELPNKPFYEEIPEGVTEVAVCALSGKLPNEYCTDLVTEYYPDYAVPTEECDMHQEMVVCKYSGKLPSPYCPAEHLAKKPIVVIPENSPYQQLTDEQLAKYVPGAFRKPVSAGMDYNDPTQRDAFCPLHNEAWYAAETQRPALEADAYRLIDQINYNIRRYSGLITQEELTGLQDAMAAVENALNESKVAPPGQGQPYYTSIPILQPDLVREKMNELVADYDAVLARIYSGR